MSGSTPIEICTRKHLQWFADGGDHTHVNAPTSDEILKLEERVLVECHQYDIEANATSWSPSLTDLGKYELARLNLRSND